MKKLRTADALLWKYASMKEALSAPRSMSFIVQTGRVFGDSCTATLAHMKGKPCGGDSYSMRPMGKGNEREYIPVCKRCNSAWPVFQVDIRAGQVQYEKHDFATRALADMTTASKILQKLSLWERRVWIERVLGPSVATWEDFARHCQKKWKRKNVSVPGGFFSERHCRTLVYAARERVEKALKRGKLWDGPEMDEEAA